MASPTQPPVPQTPAVVTTNPPINDAFALAAISILSSTINTNGQEVYITDRSKYAAILTILRNTIKQVNQLAAHAPHEDGCPPGYELCDSGRCCPDCGSN